MKNFKLENGGVGLSCYEWTVEKPLKQMIIIHGLAEHAKRYDDFAQFLNKQGISVFSMDLRGHGESIDDGLGIFCQKDGWLKVIEDIKLLYLYAKNLSPDTGIVLFGHSMGSIFARAVLQKTTDKYEKCVLSGVTVSKPGLRDIAPFMASLFPQKKPAKTLDNLTFGDFSKAFRPNRTKFDWLSRDKEQVDKYVADEKCGFVASGSMFKDVAKVLLFTLKDKNINAMPKDTPIFIISGENDPAGSFGYDAKYLAESYKKAGINVDYKIYKSARHELINEINKKEVYENVAEFVLK
ncbi:MAG: alpha/beta fold hydrolase [Eubacteriales bacterium]